MDAPPPPRAPSPPAPQVDHPSFAAFLDELSSAPGDGRLARGRQRLVDWAQRATTWGPMGPIAEVGWRTWRRDQETAGSVLAAAVAYRLFIWLLPLSLLIVVGVGVQADVAGESAGDVVERTGIAGYFARSVASAADATTPVTRVLIGGTALVVFLYESYVLLRTLRAVNAFAWGVPVRPMTRPGPDTLLFLLLTLGIVAMSAAIPPIRDATRPLGLLVVVPATLVLVPAWYLALNLLVLPHGAPTWRHLLPGAVVMGGGYSGLQLLQHVDPVPLAGAQGGDLRGARGGRRADAELLHHRPARGGGRGPQLGHLPHPEPRPARGGLSRPRAVTGAPAGRPEARGDRVELGAQLHTAHVLGAAATLTERGWEVRKLRATSRFDALVAAVMAAHFAPRVDGGGIILEGWD